MTDKPIIFSGPMVAALLAGRKTQTRRVIKPQPDTTYNTDGEFGQRTGWLWNSGGPGADGCWQGMDTLPKPYTPGDRLYVREAWRTPEQLDHLSPTQIAERCKEAGYLGPWCPRVTEADNLVHQWCEEDGWRDDEPSGRLRAAMHMPRWASRLTLTVTDVKVERVQDISEADAMAEGIPEYATLEELRSWADSDEVPWRDLPGSTQLFVVPDGRPDGDDSDDSDETVTPNPVESFKGLWDSLNAKPRPRYTKAGGQQVVSHYESFPWGGPGEIARVETHRGKPHHITPNPWVVAPSFTVHRCNIDQMGEAA